VTLSDAIEERESRRVIVGSSAARQRYPILGGAALQRSILGGAALQRCDHVAYFSTALAAEVAL
jgi:hypothetical protein